MSMFKFMVAIILFGIICFMFGIKIGMTEIECDEMGICKIKKEKIYE